MTLQDENNQTARPFISVIVPVYNDNAGLQKLIPSLCRQTWPRDSFEIIVVDNGSAQNVSEAVRDYDVILLYEPLRSSYAARNLGIQKARGRILAFIDSDCRADPQWLEEGVKSLVETGSDMAGGNVIFDLSTKPAAAEYYDAAHNFQFEQKIQRGTCGGGNLFVRRAVFDSIGLFDGSLQSGGDVLFSKKATGSGFRLVYAPDAAVYHPARRFWPLVKKTFRVGKGKSAVRLLSESSAAKEQLKTIQSGSLRSLISPAAIYERVVRAGYSVSRWTFTRIVLVSYMILLAGMFGVVYGRIVRRRK